MKDARYVLWILWRAARAPVKWDARRLFAVLRCAWRIYHARRRIARLERDIRLLSASPRFFR